MTAADRESRRGAIRRLFLPCLVWCCPAFAAPQFSDTALLPADGFLQVWKKSENPRIFTSSDLYGHIDGGAEMFLEFGFEQLTFQPYTPDFNKAAAKDSGEMQVEIYRMTDPTAATGIYLMNCGKESPDPSFRQRHTINQYQLLFKRDRYYVIVNNSDGAPGLRSAMIEFARHIAGRLPAERPAQPDQGLPQDGLNGASVRLIRGPYALQSIFTLGTGDILQLGRRITAVSGNYQDAGGKHTLVIADYPDEPAAARAFGNVQANLDKYLKVQEKSERRLVFQDYSGEYGVVSVTGKRLTVRLHLARKPAG